MKTKSFSPKNMFVSPNLAMGLVGRV